MAPRSTRTSITFDEAEIHLFHLIGIAALRRPAFSGIEFRKTRAYIRQSAPVRRFDVWDKLLSEIEIRSSITSTASRLPPHPLFPPQCELQDVHIAFERLRKDPSRATFEKTLKWLYSSVKPDFHLPLDNPVSGLKILSWDEDDSEASGEVDGTEDEESGTGTAESEVEDMGPPIRLNAHFQHFAAHRPPLSQVLGLQPSKSGPGKVQQPRHGTGTIGTGTRANKGRAGTAKDMEPQHLESARANPTPSTSSCVNTRSGTLSAGTEAVRAEGGIHSALSTVGAGPAPSMVGAPAPATPVLSPETPNDADIARARSRALERQRQLPGQSDPALLTPLEEIIRRLESCPVLNYFDLWSRRADKKKGNELLEWVCRCCKTGYETRIGPDRRLVTASLVTHLYHCRYRTAPQAAGLAPWDRKRKPRLRKGKGNVEPRLAVDAPGPPDGDGFRPSGPSAARQGHERRHVRQSYLCWAIRHGAPLCRADERELKPVMDVLDAEGGSPKDGEIEGLRDQLLSDVQASIGESPGRFALVFSVNQDMHSRSAWLIVHAAWLDPELRPQNACIMLVPVEVDGERPALKIARTLLDHLGRLGLTGKWSGFVVAPPTRVNAHVFGELNFECIKASRPETTLYDFFALNYWGKQKELRFVPCALTLIEDRLKARGLNTLLRVRDMGAAAGIVPTASEMANQSENPTRSRFRAARGNQPIHASNDEIALRRLVWEGSIRLPFIDDGLDRAPRGTSSLAALHESLCLSLTMPSDLAKSVCQTMDAIVADARDTSIVAADWSTLADVLMVSVQAVDPDPATGLAALLLEDIATLGRLATTNPTLLAASFIRLDDSRTVGDLERAGLQFDSLHKELSRQLDIMAPEVGPGLSASERMLMELRRTGPAAAERENEPGAKRRRASSHSGQARESRRRLGPECWNEVRRYEQEGLAWKQSSTEKPTSALRIWAERRADYPSLDGSATSLLAIPASADVVDRTRCELEDISRRYGSYNNSTVAALTIIRALLVAGFCPDNK